MNRRVFTSYSKLNVAAKKALSCAYPEGVDDILTTMKNVFSGELFKGFVFDHDDVTYMVEWNVRNNFSVADFSDAELGESETENDELELEEDF